LKFLLVLTSPFATLTLVGILAFLGIIWETFSPLFKWIKSWFLRWHMSELGATLILWRNVLSVSPQRASEATSTECLWKSLTELSLLWVDVACQTIWLTINASAAT
jgi:hypothetical protein